jgi:hypothetical protein
MEHRLALPQCVDWAERQIVESNFEPGYEDIIRNSLGKLAAADAQGMGLLWEDFDEMATKLGYKLSFAVAKVA